MKHNFDFPNGQFFRRSWWIAGAVSLLLLFYIGLLYNAQIVHGQDYLEQSVRTISYQETVEASRGIITDRTGQVMVANQPCYNLTFDEQRLGRDDDENAAILRLLQLCQAQGVIWEDNLPITQTAPFLYTVDQLSDTQKGRFLKYLQTSKTLRPILEAGLTPKAAAGAAPDASGQSDGAAAGKSAVDGLTAETLTSALLTRAGLSATNLIEQLRADMEISPARSLNDARLILGVRYELALRKVNNINAYVLARDVDTAFISLLNDGNYLGARITASSLREYETTAAAHILGYVGPIYREDYAELAEKGYAMDDIVGKEGTEAAFEDYLRGKDGTRLISTNAGGKITSEVYTVQPQPGHTVELTLDLSLQQATEDALAETITAMTEDDQIIRGAGAAMIGVGTGEVLALASYPTFDLTSYNQDFNTLRDDPAKPLFNRATQGTYAPGSTLKPLTAVAALETGKTTLSAKIRDTGKWVYPGDPNSFTYCWNRGGHGPVNIIQAITVSCNYYFAEMGYRMGLDTLNAYISAFGLGEKTGIEIGEKTGRPAENQVGENQAPWAAYGQANQVYTPLQLANYIATLVSGGRHYDAHLLKAVKSYDNTAVVALGAGEPRNLIEMQDSTLNAVKTGMHNLTTTGSLSGYFRNCTVDAGAKTGTAQLGSDIKNNGVIVCFAPYDEPEVALAIVIEKGGSGSALASTAVKILNAYFSADEIGTVIHGENQLLP